MNLKKHNIIVSALLACIAAIVVAVPVLAYTYYIPITAYNGSAFNYGMLPFLADVDNDTLISNGYTTTLGTRVSLAGANLPHMIADDKTLFAMPAGTLASYNANQLLGETALTSLKIIPGYGGYVTVADDAALEPTNNFEIEIDGYFDVSTVASILSKTSALTIGVSAAGEITSNITAFNGVDQSYATGSSGYAAYGVNWGAQTFTAGMSGNLTSCTINIKKQGNPAGNMTVGLYATNSNLPTGAVLATKSLVADSLTTSYADTSFVFASPYALTSGTVYALVLSATSGDASNYVLWQYNVSDGYAGGRRADSTNSGSTWPSYGGDARFSTTMLVTLSSVATGLASGVHNLKITADTTNLKTYWDAVEKDSDALGAVSVSNNANNWVLMSNATPYLNYYKHTVGGTLIVHYQPIAMISGTTLPDREGAAQNGAITWGANPADVTATVGYMRSASTVAVGSGSAVTTNPGILPTMAVPTSKPLFTNPFSGMFSALSTASGGEVKLEWIWQALFAVASQVAIVYTLEKFQSQMLAGFAGGVVIFVAFMAGAFDWWMLFIFAITVIAIVLMERKQSI